MEYTLEKPTGKFTIGKGDGMGLGTLQEVHCPEIDWINIIVFRSALYLGYVCAIKESGIKIAPENCAKKEYAISECLKLLKKLGKNETLKQLKEYIKGKENE